MSPYQGYSNYRLLGNLPRGEIVHGNDAGVGGNLWESTTKFWSLGRADLLAGR